MYLSFLLLSLLSSGRNLRESERMESLCWTGLKLDFRIFHEIFRQFFMAVGIKTISHVRISCHILNIQKSLWLYSCVACVCFHYGTTSVLNLTFPFTHCNTVPYCVILFHTVPCFAILCHAVPSFVTLCHAGQNWTFAWEGKVTSRKMVTITFWGQVSNLLNKINRFSTAGEVRGISMKIGIGEIYKKTKQLSYQL